MPYLVTDEDQPECDTPLRSRIHAARMNSGLSVDTIVHDENTAPDVVESILKGPLERSDDTKHPDEDVSQDPSMAQRSLMVDFPPKAPIQCLYSAKYIGDLHWTRPDLIFTHGAGGTLQSAAMANLTHGFVSLTSRPTILCFKGNMNLKSRVKMFAAVIESRGEHNGHGVKTSAISLGGRSMGARAAVMAATKDTTHLVLVSYPLHTDNEVRDEILLDLPESIKVIFVSGDHDNMCDLDRLEAVRRKMKCKTWRVVVRDADHGMNVKPKAGTQDVGRKTGEVVADWLGNCNEESREGEVSWDPEAEIAQWSGWSLDVSAPPTAHDEHQASTENGTSSNRTPSDRKKKPRAKRGRDVKELRSSFQADQENDNPKRARHTKDEKKPRPTRSAKVNQETHHTNAPKPKKRRKT
jgi:predicted alpha/beta-hydrolase family hydrolase